MAHDPLASALSATRESERETAWRHVCEAEDRLARQSLIVDALSRFDDERVKRLSRELLATLRRTVEVARQHLHLLEVQERRNALPSG
jgi:hypothetical protein